MLCGLVRTRYMCVGYLGRRLMAPKSWETVCAILGVLVRARRSDKSLL